MIDADQLLVSAAVGIATAATSWGAIRATVKGLVEGQKRIEDTLDAHRNEDNTRFDNLHTAIIERR